jgi:hypothetical protein
MIRGLLWLPLLGVFSWLAWAGWNEYQKLEAYRNWAEPFDHAKYDIYAVLGQKDGDLIWGKPTRQGPVELQSFSLSQVESIRLRVGEQTLLPEPANQPKAGSQRVFLEFQLYEQVIQVPFTELELAEKWGIHLQQDWQKHRPDQVI